MSGATPPVAPQNVVLEPVAEVKEEEEKKAKGVPKNRVKKDLDMNDYENTLYYSKISHVSFNSIRSKNHQIYSINQSKVGLTSYDNKRYWTDKFKSIPYGHYSIVD